MGQHDLSSTNDIGYMLQHLANVMAKQNDQALQERLGIGFSQFKILMMLERHPNVQQKQIADYLGQTEASISRQIKLMTDKGLLMSRINSENRREHITTLTAKGLRLNEESLRVLANTHDLAFGSLGDKKQSQLLSALTDMHEQVCQSGRKGVCNHPAKE